MLPTKNCEEPTVRKDNRLSMDANTRILYISHVQWNWIKQRPQYLAELLAQTYPLTFFQAQVFRGRGLKPNDRKGLQVRVLPRIPTLFEKPSFLVAHNDWIARRIIRKEIAKSSVNLIWLTSPRTFRWMPRSYDGKVIYDCMDDYDAFYNGAKKSEFQQLEQAIVKRANLILASSTKLVGKIQRLDHTKTKPVILVRNGFNGRVFDLSDQQKKVYKIGDMFKGCYFGTIGSWFDFSVLQDSLICFPNLSYKIIGPIGDGVSVLHHPRIEYTGPVAHNSLPQFVDDCDFFIMPFRINDVVLSVDPVKMYEYINYGKDIVCVRYPEVQRFADYTEFYNGSEEYCHAISAVIRRSKRKYSDTQRFEILSKSSWSSRTEQILEALGEL